MGDVAWRRDITDEKQLFSFSQEIGSPDALRMLYLVTAADVTAVGPGAWTSWKASLLTDLFDRCLVILSGRRYTHHEQQRMAAIREQVVKILKGKGQSFDDMQSGKWLKEQLDGFSAYYLTCTPAEIIASDITAIRGLTEEAIEVVGHYDPPTRTTEYRVITRNPTATQGCFHKMAGVLTAKHLSILSADINTTKSGVIVDSYRVLDQDFEDEPPEHRVQEVADALRAVLRGDTTVENLFRRHRRYDGGQLSKGVSNLSTRVRIDSESSDSRLIIDVFAHDRPGLLYTVTKELYDLGLSVDLAKIATNFDQVVDVFYVREERGGQIKSEERVAAIRTALVARLEEFEAEGFRDFLK
jgi:[protein-PII] uridylyltransferase